MLDLEAILVVLIPASLMLLGGAAALCVRIPTRLQACTQTFSAGILMAAVAGELFPLMAHPELSNPDIHEVGKAEGEIAVCIGFAVALIFMFGVERIEHLTQGHEGDDAEAGEGVPPRTEAWKEGTFALREVRGQAERIKEDVDELQRCICENACEEIDKRVHDLAYSADKAKRMIVHQESYDEHNVARLKFHVGELSANCDAILAQTTPPKLLAELNKFEKTLEHLHGHAERKHFRHWRPTPPPSDQAKLSEQIPVALTFTVTVDAAVDGLLLGLSYAASPSTGWCMSIATCIEMMFLGLSFSASVQNATRSTFKRLAVVSIPPIFLAGVGFLGNFVGNRLSENPSVFVGFIAFAIVALLFLVTQELLTEARESTGEDVLVSVTFFVGLLGGILLEKGLDD